MGAALVTALHGLLCQGDNGLFVTYVNVQMKSIEQQHSQVGTGDRHTLLVSLRDKESAMQANSLQLFGKRLQLLQEEKTMEVSSESIQSDTNLKATLCECVSSGWQTNISILMALCIKVWHSFQPTNKMLYLYQRHCVQTQSIILPQLAYLQY